MKSIIHLLTLCLIICACSENTHNEAVSYETIDYEIYVGDRLDGYQKSWQDEEGFYRYEYEFNDRGRGPHYEEKVKLDENNVISFHEIIGHNYLKDTVTETFSAKDGQAKWENTSTKGNAAFDGNAFYSSIDGSLGKTELLVRKLLSTNERSIPLIPGGEAQITSVRNVTFADSVPLDLVEITGFSFTPTYVWMDKQNRLFASVSPWFSHVRKGFHEIRKDLLRKQEETEDNYLKGLSDKLTQKPEGKTLVKNVNLFDSKTGKVLPNKTVLISGKTIEKIYSSSDKNVPEVSTVIEGNDRFLLPGLFDMHAHIFKEDGILNLAAGVTSVRDLANSLDLPDLKKAFDSNQLMGPRIVTMGGFIDKSGPYAGPIGKIVSTLEEGIEAIQFYHNNGYEQIKLYSSIDPDWVKPLTDEAHRRGMKVSGHIPAFMTAEQAVKNGYDEIQHINMLALNFLSDTIDTRSPLRFSMVAAHTHALDLESQEFKDFIRLLKREKIAVDPTVSIFESMFTTKAGDPDPSFAMILDRLPIQVRRGFYSGGLPIPEGKADVYKASYEKLLQIIKELHLNGVTIVAGTDAMAGFALHRELEKYVEAGIPPSEVLKIATITSAKVARVDKTLGSIEEGKLADLILVNGNPLENISNIRKVDLVIKDGNIYDPKQLYNSIGVKHYQ